MGAGAWGSKVGRGNRTGEGGVWRASVSAKHWAAEPRTGKRRTEKKEVEEKETNRARCRWVMAAPAPAAPAKHPAAGRSGGGGVVRMYVLYLQVLIGTRAEPLERKIQNKKEGKLFRQTNKLRRSELGQRIRTRHRHAQVPSKTRSPTSIRIQPAAVQLAEERNIHGEGRRSEGTERVWVAGA